MRVPSPNCQFTDELGTWLLYDAEYVDLNGRRYSARFWALSDSDAERRLNLLRGARITQVYEEEP